MLEIECLENKVNGKSVYIGYVKYSDLVKFAFLKPLTVNRITNKSRIKDMKEYIMKQNSNYPPIVVAVEEGCRASYNGKENKLLIEKGSNENRLNRLVIIDGQHRYLSIESLIKSNPENSGILNRKQAIYILTGISELEQRKYFMDINETMKSVSSVSKRIFQITVPNYISLKVIKTLNIIKKVNIKNDQCTNKYPYKFIQSGTEVLFGYINYADFSEDSIISKLDNYSEKGCILWKSALKFIDDNTKLNIGFSTLEECMKEDYKSIKTEIFIKAFFKQLKIEYNELEDMDSVSNERLNLIIDEFIDNIINNLKYFSYEEEINILEKKLKEKKIQEILVGGECSE